MRDKNTILTFILALLLALPAAAAHYSDFYVIPVAGHVQGAFDTPFRSEVMIQNIQDTPITVDMAFIESGPGISSNVFPLGEPVTVPARGSVLLRDVLDGYRGSDSAMGSILIGADAPFAVTSRVYTPDGAGGEFGTTVPAVPDFIEDVTGVTDDAMAIAYIPGARSNAEFRTNVGLVAGANTLSGEPMTVEIQLYAESGALLGVREVSVLPGSFNHTQFNTRLMTGATFTIGGVRMRITSGDGDVIPYIAVVNNGTGDGTFVLGRFPRNRPAGKSAQLSTFRAIFEQMRADR